MGVNTSWLPFNSHGPCRTRKSTGRPASDGGAQFQRLHTARLVGHFFKRDFLRRAIRQFFREHYLRRLFGVFEILVAFLIRHQHQVAGTVVDAKMLEADAKRVRPGLLPATAPAADKMEFDWSIRMAERLARAQ